MRGPWFLLPSVGSWLHPRARWPSQGQAACDEAGADSSANGCCRGESTEAEFSLSQMEYILAEAVRGMSAIDQQRGALAGCWVERWLRQWNRADMGDAPYFSRAGVVYWLQALASNVNSARESGVPVFTYPSSISPV